MTNPALRHSPWYRERWIWLLLAGPAAVIVAGLATTWLAFATADGLVADDYYKQGLAINRRLAKEEAARRLGVSGTVETRARRIRIQLTGDSPPALFVHLAHATRAGHDRRLRLAPVAPGAYEAELEPLEPGRWRVVIEDPAGVWRMAKELS